MKKVIIGSVIVLAVILVIVFLYTKDLEVVFHVFTILGVVLAASIIKGYVIGSHGPDNDTDEQ